MKRFCILLSGLLLAFSFAAAKPKPALPPAPVTAPPAPILTQNEVGVKAIQGILHELPLDSLARYFDDSVRANLTEETIAGFRGQISWLPRFIGDSLEPFMTGRQQMDSAGRMAFFREYRFANESNKRAPLMVVHLFFDDSTTPRIAGAYNKTFDGDTKNRIADAQVWDVPSGKIDVHSVSFVELQGGILPVVRVYDDFDTTRFDSAYTVQKAGVVIREAIARGFLAKIKAAQPNGKFQENFGVVFIRKDPHAGYTQYSFSLKPEEYDPEAAAKRKAAAKVPPAGTHAKKRAAAPAKTAK